MRPIRLAPADTHFDVLTSTRRRVTRLIILSLSIAAGLATGGGLPVALSASGGSTITVCPSGPPACDFQTIQQGLQMAAAGDTVWVAPGEYHGPVSLKAYVALRSSQGEQATAIVANSGPIVFAEGVVSATLEGFNIDGTHIISRATGILAIDSELSIVRSRIQHFQGAHGTVTEPYGSNATAIRFEGHGRLVIMDSSIDDVHGGNGLVGSGHAGGKAVGITASGDGDLSVTAVSIENLSGGDSGNLVPYPYFCSGTGGDAVAIQTEGTIDLLLRDSQIHHVWGGKPCQAAARWCVERSGAAVGIQANGGLVTLLNNQLSHLYVWQSYYGLPSYAIHASSTLGTHLEGNSIDQMVAIDIEERSALREGPESPACGPPPGTVVAIASEGDDELLAVANQITRLRGAGIGGLAIAVDAHSTHDVVLLENHVQDVTGGSEGLSCRESNACAISFRISQAAKALVNANEVNEVSGGDALAFYMCILIKGGGGMGLSLDNVNQSTVSNNAIRAIRGGRGIECDGSVIEAGDARSLYVAEGRAEIVNNVFHLSTGGAGAVPGAPNGAGVAIHVEGDTVANLANNVVTSHDVGIRLIRPAIITEDYNDLWRNEMNYSGLVAGPHDKHVVPGFTDPANGNFLLKPDSQLIDSGRNEGAPRQDIEGDPRPLDGNDDGLAVADIGVDEFWLGLQGSSKIAVPLAVRPADVITYQLSLVNDSTRYDLPGVTVTDTLPINAHYVDGSLWAANGVAGYADGTITWTGTLPANGTVAITYQATADEQLEEPTALVNRAVLNDRIGQPRTIYAVVYVNPTRRYFPLTPGGGR